MQGTSDERSLRRDLGLLVLLFAPFYLNDIVFLAVEGAPAWLAADYGSKLLALAILISLPELRRAAARSLPLRWPAGDATVLALGCAVFIIGADTLLRVAVPIEIESLVLFRYPALDLPVLYWTDISFGLLLTAFSEELAFRAAFAQLMAGHLRNPVSLNLASAVVFALIHWSHGVTAMAVAGIAGVVLMALYLRTGSVLPAVAAHYLVNLVDFA